ncbi:MAG: hypothetical protein LBN97_05765, partial [Oscillospiraceae bacterium]|nr:hypothetical protein [Oscillospiraceae bacterium]
MKKNFTRAVCALLTLVMSAMLFSGTAFAADRIASLTTSDFYLDGSAINISGYNLDNTNYFRLRDLAIIFSGTGSRFDVIYNAELKRAELYLGRDYSGVYELISGLQPAAVQLSPIPYYVDGAAFTPEAYTAGNYSYVKLRDLDKLLNFTWSWDSKGVYLTSAQVVPTIEDKLREHIISGLTERSETIDLAAYSVEKDRFSEIYTEILYDHPE